MTADRLRVLELGPGGLRVELYPAAPPALDPEEEERLRRVREKDEELVEEELRFGSSRG